MSTIGSACLPVQSGDPKQLFETAEFTYIDIASIDQAEKRIRGPKRLAVELAPSRARQQVQPGDILVSTVRPNLNAVAQIDSLTDAIASTGFCVLRPDEHRLSSRYLFHWVKSPSFIDEMVRQATGASYPAVTDAIVKSSRIPLPPMDEQRQIAKILDQAEELRAKRRVAITLLDQLPHAIFLEMFGDPTTNPKGWTLTNLGAVADVQGGLQVSSSRRALPLETPYLRVANVYRGCLNLSEIKLIRATESEIARTALATDDLLIVEGHGNPAEIGRAALWDGSINPCVHQNHLIRARFDQSAIIPSFASSYINSMAGRQHLLRAGNTTSGLNTISVSDVKRTPILRPPLEAQNEFASRLAAIQGTKTAHRAALAELDVLFASLQCDAFGDAY